MYTKKLRTPDRSAPFCAGFPSSSRLHLAWRMVRLDACADLAPLLEAIEHGREGHPRWIVVDTIDGRQIARAMERVSAAAAEKGFVSMPVDAYRRRRLVGDAELDERSLLLTDSAGGPRAHEALLHAAARSPRPHLLLTFRRIPEKGRPRFVREARAAYIARITDRESPQVLELITRASRAAAFVTCGRHAAAERLLRDVIGALARRNAFLHAARLSMTLAGVLDDRGRSRDAYEVLENAIALAQSGRVEDLIVEGRIRQALIRTAEAAFLEAEALCRAVLEAPTVPPPLKAWTEVALAEALLWQGRTEESADVSREKLSGLEPSVIAAASELKTRLLLANGETFAAGRCSACLKEFARQTGQPKVEVLAHTADLALLAMSGDLARAGEAFGAAVTAARRAKLPFRDAWARLVWVDMLRRAGDQERARCHLDRLKRLAPVAPTLLQREIHRCVSGGGVRTLVPHRTAQPPRSFFPIALLRMAQDDEDDLAAIQRVATRLVTEVHASRVDVLSASAGPVTVICSVGDGLPSRIGPRVLEAALTIGPERQNGGSEWGLPVRFASHMVGALVCRWPVDRIVLPDAAELLELVAVIMAPRVDAYVGARREEAKSATNVPELLGVSEGMSNVRKAIVRAAGAPFAVLIEGESGVGKELAARAVHHLSARRERRFCDVNCAALPEELLESELFGHAKGAFSGAVVDRAGLFEEADGGTLLLDEVADLSPRAQAKLLRAIQQQEIRRVGESFSRKIDVRIIAAANRDMRAEAAAGRFRQDLLYRLDVIRIQIPPLRERPADIPLLAEHLWNTAAARTGSRARLSPATLSELTRYSWPGNVRELQNVIASLAVAAPHRGWVRPALLPSIIGAATTVSSARLADARTQFERRFVEVALARAAGNRARAARALGLSRQGLLKTLARLGLDGAPDGKE